MIPGTLAIDIETYSSADLPKCGVYKYTEANDFTILLFAYSFNDNPVQVIDLACGEQLPGAVMQALTDPAILKTAFNANFERTCIAKYFGVECDPAQWECTMIKAAMLGLPLSLGMVAKVLNLEEQKGTEGKALIKYFSMPCKPTKANGMRLRNDPAVIVSEFDNRFPDLTIATVEGLTKEDQPYYKDYQKWVAFTEYCKQDVVTEQAIRQKISWFEIPASEQLLWQLDQRINDRGVLLDPCFIDMAINFDKINKMKLIGRAIHLTELPNPNSAHQLKQWLVSEGVETEKLTKADVSKLLEGNSSDTVNEVLQIRQEMAKTSGKKYTAMVAGICSANRLRGLLQHYGANRTGRWAGRLVQVQNLPQNKLKDLDLARQIVCKGDLELLQMLFGNVPDTLSQLIRTAFVAPEGKTFIVSDFSAIEARVIAWLAGEQWKLEVFKGDGRIYEASASKMFRVHIDKITKVQRTVGKVTELALGYQGGPNALSTMEDTLKIKPADRIPEEEKPKVVKMWRQQNPKIVRLWELVENAAIEATHTGAKVRLMYGLTFFVEKGILFIQLPSGRRLSYMRPKMQENRFGKLALTFEGMDQTTKQWCRQDTYGGKLVENIIQAIARDCLAEKIMLVNGKGGNVVMHVHDEIVIEQLEVVVADMVVRMNDLMKQPISWAPGLPLNAESYSTKYYKKD